MTTIADSKNIWSVILYASIGILAVHVLRSKADRIPVGMGLTFLLLPFLPASGIIFRIGFVVAERYLIVYNHYILPLTFSKGFVHAKLGSVFTCYCRSSENSQYTTLQGRYSYHTRIVELYIVLHIIGTEDHFSWFTGDTFDHNGCKDSYSK